MTLKKRIKELEKQRGGEVCPSCGHDGSSITKVRIADEVKGPQRCPQCRRWLWFTMDISGGKNDP